MKKEWCDGPDKLNSLAINLKKGNASKKSATDFN